jgi:exportin-2 (importin alpha re-exporter)
LILAETALRQEEKKPNYSLELLHIVAAESLPPKTRLAASLAFKNFIRLNYVDEDGNYKLPAEEVATIKQELVGLMISSPSNIQTQLGEAISIIADSDFWRRWDTLTQDLVKRLSSTDFKVTNGVLEVAHSIFVRWRPLFRSDDLYEEINHVVATFGEPFVQMLVVADRQIEANKDNAQQLKGWFETLSLLVKIFYDLSCQDIPPIIESHLGDISSLLDKYLSYTNPIFDGDDDEASPLEVVKADICEALQLYTIKFDEDFNPHAKPFITSVWNLLSTIGPQRKYDALVSRALQFLTAVASVQSHAQVFNNEQTLSEIVEKVILPNVALRDSDIEMFEDEPIEFIRRDLEGADTDSRRRAATDFLRKLLDNFEMQVTQVVFRYINHYMNEGKTDWKAKDTAIYLFLAIAAKGTVTAAQGVKTVNQYVNVVDFFEKNVAGDLIAGAGAEPIAKVDAIKFLHNFRSILTKDQWSVAFQPLIQNMASDNYVVYTYAAIVVERLLFLTNDAGEHLFTRADVEPFAKDLLQHLFTLIEKDPSPTKLQENEFLMRCIMRVLIVLKDGVVPITDLVLTHLINITNAIKANPSNPRFYYYHFEAIGALVRFSGPSKAAELQSRLWEPFFYIFAEDVSGEHARRTLFCNYFTHEQQNSSLMCCRSSQLCWKPIRLNHFLHNFRHSSSLSRRLQHGKRVVMCLVWRDCSQPSFLRQPRSLLQKSSWSQFLVYSRDYWAQRRQNRTRLMFSIPSPLHSRRKSTLEGDSCRPLLTLCLRTDLDPYFPQILTIIFTKLQGENPPDSFKTWFTKFYHVVSARGASAGFGADYFVKHTDAVQTGIFPSLYIKIVLSTTGQFAKPVDRKLGVISYTKTLCDSAAFADRYAKGWGYTCNHLLDLLKNPPQVAPGLGDEIVNEADVDDIGFGLGFTPLNTCKRGPKDDFPDITNVQQWVGQYLKEANQRTGGAIAKFAGERLEPASQEALAPYLQ